MGTNVRIDYPRMELSHHRVCFHYMSAPTAAQRGEEPLKEVHYSVVVDEATACDEAPTEEDKVDVEVSSEMTNLEMTNLDFETGDPAGVEVQQSAVRGPL